MNRRSFFARLAMPGDRGPATSRPLMRPAAGGLEPYVPDALNPWDAYRAAHLLRRTTFLPRWSDVAALAAMSPSQAVDALLDGQSNPPVPAVADSVTESVEGLDVVLRGMVRAQWGADAEALRQWYVATMRDAGLTIIEKMVGFWSNHFATEFVVDEDYVVAPLLYRQNRLFREKGLGNFKDLVMDVTLDGAMLVYLGGNLNVAGAPNENYARELLELFTTGLGHYTEGDIKEAARILTGWRVAMFSDQPAPNGMFNTYFAAGTHDIGAKTFFGVSFPARDSSTNTEFIVRRDEVRRLIDTIFERRAEAVAKFICRKLYQFFVYSSPTQSDESVIDAMADLFIQNDFEIRPVMAALLKSAHFFDNANIGAQIKTPAELEIGMARQFGNARPMHTDMRRIGQDLFDPPTVAGWPGYRDWITTTTYPLRSDIARDVILRMSDDAALTFIKQFPNYNDIDILIGNLATLLLPRPLSTERRASLRAKLLGTTPDYEWDEVLVSSPTTAARNLRDMLATLVDLPDFQLA